MANTSIRLIVKTTARSVMWLIWSDMVYTDIRLIVKTTSQSEINRR